MTTMKISIVAIVSALAFAVISPAFAGKTGDHSCCATNAAHSDAMCLDYASLSLTADQKTKIEAWQAECSKAGCTKESRRTFLKQAKGILSADQFAKLKEQCKSMKGDKKQA